MPARSVLIPPNAQSVTTINLCIKSLLLITTTSGPWHDSPHYRKSPARGLRLVRMARYVRFRTDSVTRYGVAEDNTIAEIQGDLFDWKPTRVRHELGNVTLLAPCQPTKILAVGRNYKSHLGNRPQPANPEMF